MRFALLMLCAVVLSASVSAAPAYDESSVMAELTRMRDSMVGDVYLSAADAAGDVAPMFKMDGSDDPEKLRGSYKSPGKAFVLSLAVPGLGQYYNGSRIKPFLFVGVEELSWILHVKYHNEGNDLTDEFQAFNDTYWSEERYRDFLRWTYGDSLESGIEEVVINHTLPDTKTQQYY